MGQQGKAPCPEICLAVVWHQHQPYYWELSSDELVFPWARLHATKDYCDMALRLDRFPDVHQTFNLVPSLLEQLTAYGQGSITDRYLRHSQVPAHQLSDQEKTFILERFFDAHEENLIRPHPRYAELKQKRDGQGSDKARGRMSDQDFLDLQVWFNLAWIDPWLRESDPVLRDLVAKGAGFSEEDKHQVLAKHLDFMRQVIPVHQRLQDAGTIEVTTTPFFHPILPLLCDTNEARVALPDIRLPSNRFQQPRDARSQVMRAVEYYQQRFGRKPKGMWPAEGAVSPAAAALFAEAGVQWIATDEEILARSLGRGVKRAEDGTIDEPRVLYTPYRFKTESGEIHIVFRDRVLSDLIGFHYHRADPDDAAADFVSRIERIAASCGSPDGMCPLVPVILDGENCWEYYREDGHPFLNALYERLSRHRSIRCVTISEYLEEARERGAEAPELPRLFSGSWINHSFRIWIGAEEDNVAWDLLWQARRALAEAVGRDVSSLPDLEKAWKELYIAEGSDWNWWYGEEHHTEFAEVFDRLYRKHLRNVYCFIGREPPASLDVPIRKGAEPKVARLPGRTFTPDIDGRLSDYFEWCEAGRYHAAEAGGAMHAGLGRFRWVYFGFDMDNLYVRADFRSRADFPRPGEELVLLLLGRESRRVVFTVESGTGRVRFERQTDGGWLEQAAEARAALDSIWEVAVPWSAMPALEPGQAVSFVIQIFSDGLQVERVPRNAALKALRPKLDYDESIWVV